MSSHGQRLEFLLAWWNWSFCDDAESSRKLVKQTWIWTRNSSRVLNHWGVDGNFILALHLFWSWLVFYILYNLETNQSVLVLFSLPCRCCSSCWLSNKGKYIRFSFLIFCFVFWLRPLAVWPNGDKTCFSFSFGTKAPQLLLFSSQRFIFLCASLRF